MRYYQIRISDPETGDVLVPNVGGNPGFSRVTDTSAWTYSSLLPGMFVTQYGATNMRAQRVEMNIGLGALDSPAGGVTSFVRVWGVGIAEISQASNLNGLNIEVYGGFSAGLPLATAASAYAGVLVKGGTANCVGHWTGTEMALDIFVWPNGLSASSNATTGHPSTTDTVPVAPYSNPANIIFKWQPGEPLLTPVVSALQQAYPGYDIYGAVSPQLVWSGATSTGFFANLTQFAQWVKQKTLSIISGYAPDPTDYQGVSVVLGADGFVIFDGSTATTSKFVNFASMIGQPTWVAPYQCQVLCMMRSDIHVGDYVTLQNGPQNVQGAAVGSNISGLSQAPPFYQAGPPIPGTTGGKNSSTFTGTLQCTQVQHCGDSRNPDGTQWCTALDLRAINFFEPTSTVERLPVLAYAR